MPARRSKFAHTRMLTKVNYFWPALILSLLVALGVAIFLVFRGATWKTDSNLNLVIEEDGDVLVAVFDTKNSAITTIRIPGDAQVEAAGNFGELKLKNIWKLAENEGKGGELVADTVAKNFSFPVSGWAGRDASGFVKGGVLSPLKALLASYPTSLSVSDKLKLALMVLGVREFKRVEIPLETTGFITNEKLADGTRGFVVNRRIPDSLSAIFADDLISGLSATVEISDGSGAGASGDVAKILEVYGAKVAAVNKVKQENYDCRVASRKEELVQRIAALFHCQIVKPSAEGLDIEIWLGTKFADRF